MSVSLVAHVCSCAAGPPPPVVGDRMFDRVYETEWEEFRNLPRDPIRVVADEHRWVAANAESSPWVWSSRCATGPYACGRRVPHVRRPSGELSPESFNIFIIVAVVGPPKNPLQAADITGFLRRRVEEEGGRRLFLSEDLNLEMAVADPSPGNPKVCAPVAQPGAWLATDTRAQGAAGAPIAVHDI